MKLTHAVVGAGLAMGVVAFALHTGDAEAGERIGRQERARIELGRRLFMDDTVSGAGKFSCASCHDPEHGFSDPRRFSVDENGPTARHSQPVVELMGEGFHWDGEFDRPEQLLLARLGTPLEAMNQTRELLQANFAEAQEAGLEPDVAAFERRIQSLTPPYYGPVTPRGRGRTTPLAVRLMEDERYARGFRAAFGSDHVDTKRLVEAVASYMESLEYAESPFDRFLGGDEDALSASARRGLELFQGEANCASCHTVDGSRPTFSDGKFHNTGVAFRRAPVPHLGDLALEASASVTPVESDVPGRTSPRSVARDVGRSNMSFVGGDTAHFKTPSLRDVAVRPPYMHDGSFATLHDVVDYYADGGTPNPHLDRRVDPLELSAQDRADLVAFLESLTGVERPGLGRIDDRPNDRARIVVESLEGVRLKQFEFSVTAAGDRLVGKTDVPNTQDVQTNRSGFALVDFPASTHVLLHAADHELGLGRAVPDYVETAVFIATPLDKVSLRVVMPSVREAPGTLTASPLEVERKQTVSPLEFKLVRALGEDEYLYVADKGPLSGERLSRLQFPGLSHIDALLDWSGGMSETVHVEFVQRGLPPTGGGRGNRGNGGDGLRGGPGGDDGLRGGGLRGGLRD